MFLLNPNFFVEEKAAPILDRNEDYLKPELVNQIIQRTREWVKVAGNVPGFALSDANVVTADQKRIITQDAERTFLDPERRKIQVRVLSSYVNKYGDYHQGLSLVCGFLLLSLSEVEVASIITALTTRPMYIPEYWRAEAIAAARDAYVFEYLLQQHQPDLAALIRKRGLLPEAYCPKWFIALNINVLPFSSLYRFIEIFLEQGHLFLFKFGISFVTNFKSFILSAEDHKIFSILRYDKEVPKLYDINNDSLISVVENASKFELVPFDIDAVRTSLYKQHLEDRMNRARKQADNPSSDDDEDNDESGSSGGAGAQCGECKDNVPDMWCAVCKKLLCERCHSKSKNGHVKSHKVDEDWEKYEE